MDVWWKAEEKSVCKERFITIFSQLHDNIFKNKNAEYTNGLSG